MDINQLQQDISIIKEMIEKTRRQTANSGHLFIFIGVFSALATVGIGLLEIFSLQDFFIPLLILMAVVNGITGYFIISNEEKKEKVKDYTRIFFWNVWMVCGLSALLIVFVFPFLNVYSFGAVPIITSVLMGIALFLTGVLFEMNVIKLSSLIWWVGAILLGLYEGPYGFLIIVVVIVVGWLMPGLYLNRQYKNTSD